DLRRDGLTKDKVVATIVRLLETTYLRIGNQEYARQNNSFGLTTLRNRHVDVKGATIRFLFKGKSGVEVSVGVTDRRVARVIKRCEELPGQNLFQYIDAEGDRSTVSSDDVNQYLRDATGGDFTAKDFRTWAGTVLAACALREAAGFESETEAKRKVVEAIDSVARKLGHTRAVCRRSYVHPVVIDTFMEGDLAVALSITMARTTGRLRGDEAAVMFLLRRWVAGRRDRAECDRGGGLTSGTGPALVRFYLSAVLRPAGVISAGAVGAVIGVRPEIVAQPLDQVRRSTRAPVAVVVGERGRERGD